MYEGVIMSDILENCTSVRSLKEELLIQEILMQHAWDSHIGVLYEDPIEHKLRELDCVGRRHWCGNVASHNIGAHIVLMVESKSIADFTIAIANYMGALPQGLENSYLSWLGDSNLDDQLAAALGSSGINAGDIDRCLQQFHKCAYPDPCNDRLIEQYVPPIMAAPTSATSFREAHPNPQKDKCKDNDIAVLWRASSALRSAIIAGMKAYTSDFISNMSRFARAACYRKNAIQELLTDYSTYQDHFTYYHPIVVVDAELHPCDIHNDRKQVPWFRLLQCTIQHDLFWYDVVQRKHFSDYVRKVTEHYESFFAQQGCKESKGMIL